MIRASPCIVRTGRSADPWIGDDPRAMTTERNDAPTAIEPRWPVALAVSFFIAVTIVLRLAVPDRASLGPAWLVPGIEIATLFALLAADPAHVRERRRWLRPVSIGLVVALAAAALISTAILIADLIQGGKVT
jgi:hypothetical protein